MQDLHYIIPFLLIAHYLRRRISLWLLSQEILNDRHVLLYRIYDRIKDKRAKVQFLKASVKIPHHQYLEYSLNKKALIPSMNPFPEGQALSSSPEFKSHIESFPRLLLKELSIKFGQLKVIAVFKEGYGPDSLEAEFPQELKDWFLKTTKLIEKNPGKKQTSWLIKLDQYTDYLIQNPFLFMAFCFTSFIPASFFPRSPLIETGPRTIPLLYLTGIGIISLCFFVSKNNLFLRSVSKALLVVLAVTALQLLSVVHKS